MIATAISDDLVIGLLLGLGLGLLVGPLIRSWLVWREWSSASQEADGALREADLIAHMLEPLDAGPESTGHPDRGEADVPPRANGRTR